MGAWIETYAHLLSFMRLLVAPLWGRGFKRFLVLLSLLACRVAPLWERGLKRIDGKRGYTFSRRSLMGAWIETRETSWLQEK